MDEHIVETTLNIADQQDGMSTIEPTKTEPAKTEPAKAEKPDSAELEKLKAALSRANSQAAEYKRALREKQTESERAAAERAEQEQAMRDELEALRKEKDIGDTINRGLALNAETDVAQKMGEAWFEHDKVAMFDCIKAIVEATVARMNQEALNRQPGLSAGTPPTKGNVEDELTAKLRRYAGLPVHR